LQVGVLRRLALGTTLLREADAWVIDLTKFKHKTSRFYGPSKTQISHLVNDLLDDYVQLTTQFEFDMPADAPNRTQRRYLFAMQTDANRCHEPSAWSRRFEDAMERCSPRHTRTPPSLLRKSFITQMRTDCPDDLSLHRSCAHAQKHSVQTQGDVYDLDHHKRLLQRAVDYCHAFAAGEAQGAAAEPAPEPPELGDAEPEPAPMVASPEHPVSPSPKRRKAGAAGKPEQGSRAVGVCAEGHVLEAIVAATHAAQGGDVYFDTRWRGHDGPWWQRQIDASLFQRDDLFLNRPVVFCGCGDGPATTTAAAGVLGEVVCADDSTVTRAVLLADASGQPSLDMARALLDGSTTDWKLAPGCGEQVTDHLVDWSAPALVEPRKRWLETRDKQFPAIGDARAVIAALPVECLPLKQQVTAARLKGLLAREAPSLASQDEVRVLARSLAACFVPGGLVHDAFRVIGD
jgi:hypothetical protein